MKNFPLPSLSLFDYVRLPFSLKTILLLCLIALTFITSALYSEGGGEREEIQKRLREDEEEKAMQLHIEQHGVF